jgi:hypothetical protein
VATTVASWGTLTSGLTDIFVQCENSVSVRNLSYQDWLKENKEIH